MTSIVIHNKALSQPGIDTLNPTVQRGNGKMRGRTGQRRRWTARGWYKPQLVMYAPAAAKRPISFLSCWNGETFTAHLTRS